MRLEGKRILITGASGFVGRHLAEELRREGAEVVTLDAREEYSVDVRDWQGVRAFGSKLGKLDLVYHLAALMFVPYSFENPRETYEVNVLGTLNILELCRLYNIGNIVFASSYVYGSPEYLPIDEDHPLNPTSPYARSKAMGEGLCRAYHEDYGLKCIILRPFNIYGKGQSDSFLIPSILKQLVSGEIELMDPEPRRDFLYISDAVEAYVKAGQYTGSDFEVFNIGSGVSYSVDSIASRIIDSWGQDVKVGYHHQKRRAEIADVVAGTKKAKEKLGWEPRIDLAEGVSRYVEWYKRNLG